MEDIHYQNQKQYCQQNKVPMFASSSCSHTYSWVRDNLYGKEQTLGEMLVDKYGHDRAFIMSSKDRKSTRLNSSHIPLSRMPSSA